MAKDILSHYGPESKHSQAGRARTGGVKSARDVMGYSPPQGPTNINDPKSPGLHGDTHGMAHCPTAKSGSGSPGLHGKVSRHGSQR